MEVLKRGHKYRLTQRAVNTTDAQHEMFIEFVNLEPGHEEAGTTTQEILRVLIDRTHYCHNCLPHRVNEQIIWHFRQAIALHESRAIEQKAWKGEVLPELLIVGEDGHFDLVGYRYREALEEFQLTPAPPLGEQKCNHRSGK